MISSTPFVVVDLETTGLEPRLDRIVEIAAVKVLNGQIVDEWSSLVNPGIFVPQETTDITGITTELLYAAPQFRDVADEYLRFLGEDSVFAAHNVDFDRSFMNHHLIRVGLEAMPHPYLCTFKLAKLVYPNFGKYGLGALADMLKIDLMQAHRAIHDARATAELLIRLLSVLQSGGLRDLARIPGIQNLPSGTARDERGQGRLF
ncbi:MAG: 3'-5' exonuclease [Candidatus Gracilibacteria bacterium]|jgi:DNA polymerase-3 subunit epsilon